MTDKKQSLWLHYGLSACIVLLTLLTVAWYATERYHDFFIQHQQDTLESRAITVDQAIKTRKTNNACHVLQESDPTIRVTIVDTLGVVLCDSDADAIMMENHETRPEIVQALNGQRGSDTRVSETLQTSMLYLAIPSFKDEKVVGVIRTAIPLLSIESLLDELYRQFLILLVVLLAVVSVVVVNLYRKFNQPLAEIAEQANLFAQGDFSNTLPDYDIKEIAELGGALNRMAEQLDRLENLRQDFVANVSHELKTPIATIKSYVETLLDGAQHDPADLDRFLNIVLKQNDRLAAIVDDLLTLSRLESAPITQILALNETDACQLLHSSAENCQTRAEAKNITININCKPNLSIQVDHSLMTQALVNLIDNAIKYSNENKAISVSAEEIDSKVQLSISDQGPGIPEQHIPRLFERFYRIDKSRSRREGGTGLGLAIVKHIVHIHGGLVKVSNNASVGCCFVIILPRSH